MIEAMRGWVRAGAAASLVIAAACGNRGEGGQAARTDTAAPQAATASQGAAPSQADSTPRQVARVDNLQAPESAVYDAELDVWFVSNINGKPDAKDNNGFIARVSPEGKVDSLKFIAAGARGVTLNAPKGMAVVGDTLWVADIDAVRAFNTRTGAPVATVDLRGQAKFLNDVATSPDGIYVTDTQADRIYRIGADHKATVVLESKELHGPNGITWDASGQRFVIVPYGDTTLFAWTPGGQAVTSIGTGPGRQDGVEALAGNALLISSWADSSLFVLRSGRTTRIIGNLPSPADIGVDRKRGLVAVPMLMEGRLEIWSLPASLTAGS